MFRRTIFAYALVMSFLFIAALGTGTASLGNSTYIEAVGRQSTYTMTVSAPRKTVYDRNLTPLTNTEKKYIAAVIPDIDTLGALQSVTEETQRAEVLNAFENGRPFLIEVRSPVNTDGITCFSVYERYGDPQPASNLIGYLENGSTGVSGIEKCFDSELRQNGETSVTFTVDAIGQAIKGAVIDVRDTAQQSDSGIALTIDRSIQAIVESSCSEIQTGAAVVMECRSGKILASASFPSIDPNRLDKALENENDPYINRALCAYAPGSVFKLITAAAALEEGVDFRWPFTCTGSTFVDGKEFPCFDGIAHGEVNMHTALRQSCNGYFIQLTEALGADKVLSLAESFRLGHSLTLANGLAAEAGTLPNAKDLSHPRASANFSFGQGEITATPLHVAAYVNAIASDGIFYPPQIYLGAVDENLVVTAVQTTSSFKAIEKTTAEKLRNYMESTARFGTARPGAATNCISGIKTGTAQTGVKDENGNEIQNFWYAGYICGEDGTPAYTIVLMEESGGETVIPSAFKKISETLADFT